MNIAELTTTIIVVAVLVILAVSVSPYVVRRLRRPRRSRRTESRQESPGGWYFVRYSPEESADVDDPT